MSHYPLLQHVTYEGSYEGIAARIWYQVSFSGLLSVRENSSVSSDQSDWRIQQRCGVTGYKALITCGNTLQCPTGYSASIEFCPIHDSNTKNTTTLTARNFSFLLTYPTFKIVLTTQPLSLFILNHERNITAQLIIKTCFSDTCCSCCTTASKNSGIYIYYSGHSKHCDCTHQCRILKQTARVFMYLIV